MNKNNKNGGQNSTFPPRGVPWVSVPQASLHDANTSSQRGSGLKKANSNHFSMLRSKVMSLIEFNTTASTEPANEPRSVETLSDRIDSTLSKHTS